MSLNSKSISTNSTLCTVTSHNSHFKSNTYLNKIKMTMKALYHNEIQKLGSISNQTLRHSISQQSLCKACKITTDVNLKTTCIELYLFQINYGK